MHPLVAPTVHAACGTPVCSSEFQGVPELSGAVASRAGLLLNGSKFRHLKFQHQGLLCAWGVLRS